MAKQEKHFKLELNYSLTRNELIKILLRRYYSKLSAKITGPIVILLGLLIGRIQSLVGIFIAVCGVFYTIVPYLMILKNYRKIEDNEVKLILLKDKVIFDFGSMKLKVAYKSIQSVVEDNDFVRIKPFPGNKEFLKEEIIPKNNITKGNLNNFVNTLKEKILNNEGKENLSQVEQVLMLQYEVDKKDIFRYVKIEYNSIKRYKMYGAVFLIVGLMLLSAKTPLTIVWGCVFIIIALSYFLYPHLIYLFKIRKLQHTTIKFSKRGFKEVAIEGEGINIITSINQLGLIEDNYIYMKVVVFDRNNMIFYIPKEKISAGSLGDFIKTFEKGKHKKNSDESYS